MLSPQGSLSLLIKFGLNKPAHNVLRKTQQNGGEISSFHRRCCFWLYLQLILPENQSEQNSMISLFGAKQRCFEAKQRCFEAEYRCFEAEYRCFEAKYRCFGAEQL